MTMIQLDQAKAGDVLAADVLDSEQRLLCKKGTALTARLLERFEQLGVSSLSVQTDPAAELQARCAAIDMALDQRFEAVIQDPWMAMLKRCARRALVDFASNDSGGDGDD